MLVARRDPPFHIDAEKTASIHSDGSRTTQASGLTRFLAAMQIIGSLLAIPVGIASAYSFYRANFSPDTTCQTLRSGIISLLDKSVDAATRRALVRRDVETFEKTCATVDPEATAAFKTLLTAEKLVTPSPATLPATDSVASRPKETVRKIESRPQAAAKQPASMAPPAAAEPLHRDAAVSDSQWLDAVRQALVTHKPEPMPLQAARPQAVPAPVARSVPQETTASAPVVAPAAAPALPPAITVTPPQLQRVDADHPVPPQSIPDPVPAPPAETPKPDEQGRSRIGKWISSIPLLGNVVDNARH